MKTKYIFDSYWKYCFVVICEYDGKKYSLDDDYCNGGDIYRLDINATGEATIIKLGECVEIDGVPFTRN